MSGARPSVIFDTNIVRCLIHGDPKASRFRRLLGLRVRYEFALLDTSLYELIADLHAGDVRWDEWRSARGLLAQVIDRKRPVRSRWEDSSWPKQPDAAHRRTMLAGLRAMFQQIVASRRPEDAFVQRIFDREGNEWAIEDWGDVAAEIEKGRAGYIARAEEGRDFARQHGLSVNDIDEVLESEKDAWRANNAEHLKNALSPKSKYSFRGRGRAGDDMDGKLLVAMSFPAYVLTEDLNLRNRLRDRAAGDHGGMIMTLDEFVDGADAKALVPLWKASVQ
jgi:hypothetical protein